MTIDEFLALLPREGWVLDDGGAIRRADDTGDCPWLYAKISLRDIYAPPIWYAADNAHGHDPELRRRLLAACGLEEGA